MQVDSERQRTSGKSSAEEQPALSRDPKYYINDADCVVRVEQTLFKIHRFLLCRDSSIFNDMFSIPPPDDGLGLEGASDERPLVLVGDTADSFRALLWVLYALPHELERAYKADADIPRLLTIAEYTHKYQFTTMMPWAIRLVYEVLSGTPGKSEWNLESSDANMLSRLLDTAILCGHDDLRDLVVNSWLQQFPDFPDLSFTPGLGSEIWLEYARNYPNNPLRVSRLLSAQTMKDSERNVVMAINAAEKHDIRELKGPAYYQQLVWICERSNTGRLWPLLQALDSNALTSTQRTYLLHGHMSLVALWDQLSIQPPTFQRHATCLTSSHESRCLKTWNDRWLYAARHGRARHTADVLGSLYSMISVFYGDSAWTNGFSVTDCKTASMAALMSKITGIVTSLADHFTDQV